MDADLAKDLEQYDVKFTQLPESTFLRNILSWILPAVVFFLIWQFMARRMSEGQGMGGGLLSIGKSKAKVYMETDTKVTFDDVAGSTKRRRNSRRSELPEGPDALRPGLARACRRACCWWGRPAPERRVACASHSRGGRSFFLDLPRSS